MEKVVQVLDKPFFMLTFAKPYVSPRDYCGTKFYFKF